MASIRAPREEDAPGMARFLVEAWREAYAGMMPAALLDAIDFERRQAGFQRLLQMVPATCGAWVAESPDGAGRTRFVGWAAVGPCRDAGAPPEAGELYSIHV